jgi:SAM-dependent methyltransferase
MELQQQRWNEYYRSLSGAPQDTWINKYKALFDTYKNPMLLDLGCGNGSNLPFLIKTNCTIFALDYSEEAIEQVNKHYLVNAVVGDIRDPLPYNTEQFDFIISDLSLHYFSEKDTFVILGEIHRVLKPNGIMLARLNSIKDKNHGAQQGKEIEKNFYEHNGLKKRFFTEETIRYFFKRNFNIINIEEERSGKYLEEKHLLEVVMKRSA